MKTILVVGAANAGKSSLIQELGSIPNVQFEESIVFEHKDSNRYDGIIIVYDTTQQINTLMLQAYCNNACNLCNTVMVYGSKTDISDGAPLLNIELSRARANGVQVWNIDLNQIRSILSRMQFQRRSE